MENRLIKNFRQYIKFTDTFPKFRLGTLLVAICCFFLIVIATFIPLPLRILTLPGEAFSNPTEFFANLQSLDQITKTLNYIPQIPVVILITSMLGAGTGTFCILLYAGAGLLGFPVFASGGGLSYLSRYGFGYILGFFAGTIVTGKILSNKTDKASLVKSAIAGVIAIHVIGIIYLCAILFFGRESILAIFGWIWQSSGIQILYDLVLSIIAVFLGRFLRHALWIVMD